jgi:hypothetical protein
MVLREVELGGTTRFIWLRIGSSGGLLLNKVIELLVPQHVEKFLSSQATGSFSMRTRLDGVS